MKQSLVSRFLIVLLFGFMGSTAYASIDVYKFQNDVQQVRFQELVKVLRCPKCMNQSIGDSDAPIAKDMRDLVHKMILENKSDGEIKDYLVARYGEYVLYEPPMDKRTIVLYWGAPTLLILMLIGALVLVRNRSRAVPVTPLTDAEQKRIADMLKKVD